MKMSLSCIAISVLLGATGVGAAGTAFKPEVRVNDNGVRVMHGPDFVGAAVTPTFKYVDVRQLPALPQWRPGDPIKEIPRRFETPAEVNPIPVNPVLQALDPNAERQRAWDQANPASRVFTTPVQNFEGQPNSGVMPSDVNGDMGPNHYVQSINGSGGSLVRIYNKADGTPAGVAFSMDALGSGGPCAAGAGDPVIIYDELSNRWVFTEFTSGSNDLCVYISNGSNPVAATWTRYNFLMPSFPDYPHYGVWPDAIYVAANESGTAGARPVYAFDRAQMLAGLPATFQRFTLPNLAGFGFQAWQPADHEGGLAPPPAGARGIFLRNRDDESHNAGSNNPTQDFIEYAQLLINFTTPASSTLTGPVQIAVSEFDSNINGLSAFNAFPQPNGQKLDPLREQVMNKLVYRNFGSYEAVVGNFVTDVDTTDTGGIRWFELRRSGGIANPWTLFQEGTYAPADVGGPADRWMAGSAMDETGNIAMGYSITRQSPAINPGIRYVGRLIGDAAGVMTTPETTLIDGGGSQSGERWGDYHSLSVDPVDGCTFWVTAQYVPTSSWSTRIGAFRFDECGSPTFTLNGSVTNSQICANSAAPTALPPITLTVSSINGYVTPVNLSFPGPLPTGFAGSLTPPTVTPPGTSALNLSVNNTATPGATPIQVDGVSGAINRSFTTNVFVATAIPGQVALVSPADGALGQPLSPTLSWSSVTQTQSYLVEVATDAAFTTIVFTQSISGGTNVVVSPALNSSTNYFWRVTSNNVCGPGTTSEVRQFRTQAAAGDCDVSQTANPVFTDTVENGTNGFTVSGTGASLWSISAARPFNGANAWLAVDHTTVSNQLLVSPPIVIPTGELPVTLQFHSDETLEDRSGGCFDGGLVEFSTNAGGTWTAFAASAIVLGPYDGLIDGGPLTGWCGDPRAYNKKVLDLSALQGQTAQFRFRLSTDSSVGRVPHGWYVDNIRVQSCSSGPPIMVFASGFE